MHGTVWQGCNHPTGRGTAWQRKVGSGSVPPGRMGCGLARSNHFTGHGIAGIWCGKVSLCDAKSGNVRQGAIIQQGLAGPVSTGYSLARQGNARWVLAVLVWVWQGAIIWRVYENGTSRPLSSDYYLPMYQHSMQGCGAVCMRHGEACRAEGARMAQVELYLGDCLTELDTVPDESVNLCFVDPPYNNGIFGKMPVPEYLAWCEQWIALCSRLLTPNGAFWVSHSDPGLLVDISRIVERYGRGRVNWITWDKYNDAGDLQGFMDGYTVIGGLRSFQVMAEYLVYHTDEGQWTAQCDKERGFIFEPLRAYLDGEWKRAGLSRQEANVACNTASMAERHFFSRSQWCLPTEEHYRKLRAYANRGNGSEYLRREYEDLRREYEDLRREYEDLRREYESLRYTFNNPGKISSVWQIPPAARNGHLTPKPEALLERIILATSNEGDTVLDPMMGSGTAIAVPTRLGRRGIGCEINKHYFEMAKRRIEAAQAAMIQASLPGVQP